MQFYYGDKMPLRILDEGEFWKHQEAEHTEVIRALTPNLEAQYVRALQDWEQAFHRTHGMFVQYIETAARGGQYLNPQFYQSVLQLVHYAMEESRRFIDFLNQLAADSEAIRRNQTALVVLNHIRRESEYFIGISQALLYHRSI